MKLSGWRNNWLGFEDANQGGVHFDGDGTEQAIFSQWMEILPTDQVAALAVEYDPKTLQVKEPPA